MINNSISRIRNITVGYPLRWQEVLEIAILDTEFVTEESRLIESVFVAHSSCPKDLKAAEAVLAGDAFIPMAIDCMLEKDKSLTEIDSFLLEATNRIASL